MVQQTVFEQEREEQDGALPQMPADFDPQKCFLPSGEVLCPWCLANNVRKALRDVRAVQSHSNLHHGGALLKDIGFESKSASAKSSAVPFRKPAVADPALKVLPEAEVKGADPLALDTPEMRMQVMARQLGVSAQPAAAMANYLALNYDTSDPGTIWNALKTVTEIPITLRRRFFETWCSANGIALSEHVRAQVVEATKTPDEKAQEAKSKEDQAKETKLRRVRFYNVNNAGAIYPVSGEEQEAGEGMTFTEAVAVQGSKWAEEDRRKGREPKPDTGEPIAVAVINAMTRLAEPKPQGDNGMHAILEANNRATDAQMRLMGEQFGRSLDTMAKTITGLGQVVEKALGQLNQEPAEKPKSTIEQLMERLQVQLLEKMINPPAAPVGAGVTIAVTGPDGQAVPMPFEAWERMEKVKNQRDMIGAVKENVPAMIDAVITGIRGEREHGEDAQRPAKPKEQVQVPPGHVLRMCAQCDQPVAIPKRPDVQAFRCPRCGMHQTMDGKPYPEPEEPEPTAQVETEAVVKNEEQEEDMLRILCGRCKAENILSPATLRFRCTSCKAVQDLPDDETVVLEGAARPADQVAAAEEQRLQQGQDGQALPGQRIEQAEQEVASGAH